jgi:SNF2 family DNA or RNA helicase
MASYRTLLRQSWIGQTSWRLVVLDEGQAIKNPNAKQAKPASFHSTADLNALKIA